MHAPLVTLAMHCSDSPSGVVALDLIAISGETYNFFVRGTAFVSAVARKLQVQQGWPEEPLLVVGGQVLEGNLRVTDVGSTSWQVVRVRCGLSLADWRPKLSLWREQAITERKVQIQHDRWLPEDQIDAVPVGADRLLVYFRPNPRQFEQMYFGECNWLVDACGRSGEDGHEAMRTGCRQLPLPFKVDTNLRFVHFDGSTMTVITSGNTVLRYDLKGATRLDIENAHFLHVGDEMIIDEEEILDEKFPATFLDTRGIRSYDLRRHSISRVEKFKQWVMPTEVRRGHEGVGAQIFDRSSGDQVGYISADKMFHGVFPLEKAVDGDTLLDAAWVSQDGFCGLRVFDLRTGSVLNEFGGEGTAGRWLCTCALWEDLSGLLPGESQSFFRVHALPEYMWEHGGFAIEVSFFTPDPTLSHAQQKAMEAAKKAQLAEQRRAQATQDKRRLELADTLDENPHFPMLVTIERALGFCKSFRYEPVQHVDACGDDGDDGLSALRHRHDARRAHQRRSTNRPIKHTVHSLGLFDCLEVATPTSMVQLPETVRQLETKLAECRQEVEIWESGARQRARVKQHILEQGTAPLGAALLRLAFGFDS